MIALRSYPARADDLVRKPSETDGALMNRALGPSTEPLQGVVRSTELAGGRLVLIGFAPTSEDGVVGHLLIERSPGHFEHATFPSCGPEGAPAELLAVFFARTEKDKPRDLAVLCRWEEIHATASGMLYGAEFYRVDASGPKTVIRPLTDFNKKFTTGAIDEVDARGKVIKGSKPAFTTVAGVKKLLVKMGLKQSP
jgi:hypothetical protein